ncbi:MAG: hypothetical protein AAFN93_16155 [Bacteroidota bacterium]
MKILLPILFGLLIVNIPSFAQSKNDKDKKVDYSNSFEPYTPEESRTVSVKKKKVKKQKQLTFREAYFKSLEDKKEDFQKLMIANAKKRKKIARQMQKPQYSDPSYFGHKRKPKKRSLKKRKFCKECGIVH